MKKKEFPGTLFLVVGNSGSGKDSIINEAIEKYPKDLKNIYRVRRYITRPPSKTENNISVSPEKFLAMEQNEKFALKWHIYNLYYGIPKKIDKLLKKGNPVVANVSRSIIPEARGKYKNLKVIFIYVPINVTEERLLERGREKEKSIVARIKRAKKLENYSDYDFKIENTGSLDKAVQEFLDIIVPLIKDEEI
jgi:phosphonate metabolism protein PhnN/1,5-bisphosphokinase (PRPP-forming)